MFALIALSPLSLSYYGSYRRIQAIIFSFSLIITFSRLLFCNLLATIIGDLSSQISWLNAILAHYGILIFYGILVILLGRFYGHYYYEFWFSTIAFYAGIWYSDTILAHGILFFITNL